MNTSSIICKWCNKQYTNEINCDTDCIRLKRKSFCEKWLKKIEEDEEFKTLFKSMKDDVDNYYCFVRDSDKILKNCNVLAINLLI